MGDYEVTVSTGNFEHAGTLNQVFIKLVGIDGESERKCLRDPKGTLCFDRGAVSTFTVSCRASIGELILIELDKQHLLLFPEDSWFPAKVVVKSPGGLIYNFPIYRWITDSKVHRFREGTALTVTEDSSPLGRSSRERELKQRKKEYCWDVYAKGLPQCMKVESILSLPSKMRFSFTKDLQLLYNLESGMTELLMEGVANSKKNWPDIHAIDRVFPNRTTDISDYVRAHWKEDAFFGHQILNGINPMLIRRCSVLPVNLPVTDNMVFPSGQYNLADEMKNDNIFLCDYKNLDGLKANTIHGTKQYLMAPLVLLHKTPDDKLMPIAIQLKQTPADDNPIFLPSDSEYDWLIAKIFVRSADFNEHELNVHLLRTHLLAEVFALSLLRNVPMVHPLYKLLIPHIRDTFEINFLAREYLISKDGVFTKFTAAGGEATIAIMKRSLSSLTYSSLCIPDDIAERGLKDVPNFCYRDDGLKLWDIIYRFVQEMLRLHYKKDAEVQQDSEVQEWILEIFEHGFLSQKGTGIPKRFNTVAELVKFVTMVIFTCSAQHAAVNNGQYDYDSWMPNSPSTLQRPPPTSRGTTSKTTMLQTLPDEDTTGVAMALLYLLSQQYSDFVRLGQYPEEHFTGKIPRQLIRVFQGELEMLSARIKIRNESLEVPYTYLDPATVQNSVAI